MPTSIKNQLFFDIKKKVLDIFSTYDSNGMKITFNIPPDCKNAEKIRMEITEFK